MVKNRQKYLLLSLAIISISIYAYYVLRPTPNEPEYGDLTAQQAYELIKSDPSLVIVDVRTKSEYDAGHIEDTILIPVNELESRLDELSKNDELLVYCRTGNRSSNAVSILKKNGFTKIYHLKDGITGWLQEGYPTVK